jgi:endonuclease III
MANDKKYDFSIDRERLTLVAQAVYSAAYEKKGIFSLGFKRFLPQYNLPKELEFDPQKTQTKNPLNVANYLWRCAFFERLSQSRVILNNAHKLWNNPDKNWIFNPKQTAKRGTDEIEKIISEDFQFGLRGRNEESPVERIVYNNQKLIGEYDADPRNLINNYDVKDARKNLMEFKGIGSGIANLFIIYLLDREIATPIDPENILFKVDTHKGRIPINTDSIIPENGKISRDKLTGVLEREYLAVVQELKLDASFLDAALWIIGSEVCVKRDYSHCRANCPLVDRICVSNVQEEENTGKYYVYDASGKRVETRKNIGQEFFDF